METFETDSDSEKQHLTDENTIKTEQIAEVGAMNTSVVSTEGVTTQELTEGWQIDKKLGECMVQMFDAELWTDVTFRCADQSEENLDDRVLAHKIVLAARSPVFQAMFFGPLKDSSEEIIIQDAEGGKFKSFLRLLYSDNVDLVDEFNELVDSLEMSHKYKVQFLVDGCCRRLAKKITVENSCELLNRALLYDNQYLIDHVSGFIDRNAEKVLLTDGYLQMSLSCLTYILKGDTFHANEADIFNNTIEWAKRRCVSSHGRDLRKSLGDAFYFLRSPTMTISEFGACTKRKGFYSIEEQEDLMDIVDRLETYKVEITCNNNRKRYATELSVTRPEGASEDTVRNEVISETISLLVQDNVYLSKIKLTNFKSAYHHHTVQCMDHNSNTSHASGFSFKPQYHTTNTTRTIDASSVVSLKYAQLAVILKIDDVLIPGKYTQISGDTPSTITLETPYPLYSGKTYTLQAGIYIGVVEELQLQARRSHISDSFTCLRNDIIIVETQTGEDNAELIQSLCFKRKSNRE